MNLRSILPLALALALPFTASAQSRYPLSTDASGNINRGFTLSGGQTITIPSGATLDASNATLIGLGRDGIKAPATYSSSGDTTFTGGDWFHAATLDAGTYTRNLVLNPSSVLAGQRAEVYIESGTGAPNLKIWNSAASGTALFDFTGTSTAAARGLAKFINNGSAWIVAGPNVMHYYAGSSGGGGGSAAASETPTSLAGRTAPTRRYSAATYAATASGTALSALDDLSTNGADAAQTGGARPTKEVLGDFNVIRFDGTDDYMTFSQVAGLSDFTALVVLKSSDTSVPILGAMATEGANEVDQTQLLGLATGELYILDNDIPPDLNYVESSAANVSAGLTVVAIRVEEGAVAFYRNGTSAGTGSIRLSDPPGDLSVGTIGATRAEFADPFAGFIGADIAEIIIWDSAISDLTEVTTAIKAHFSIP